MSFLKVQLILFIIVWLVLTIAFASERIKYIKKLTDNPRASINTSFKQKKLYPIVMSSIIMLIPLILLVD
ncbi:MAG: hypothetical protein ACRCX8_10765 [Sarcina sp.]